MIKSVKYIYEGIHTLAQGKIEVPVLDGTAIGVSIIRRDINTASSFMFDRKFHTNSFLFENTCRKTAGALILMFYSILQLQYYLITKDFVTSVKIYDRTKDIVICYDASRSEILTALKEFYHGIITVPDNYQERQSRQ